MTEELRLVPRSTSRSSPTLRDLLAVIFRQRRPGLLAFVAVFLAVVAYGMTAPTYQSGMKVLLRRERVDPALTPIPSGAEFEREGITEEQVNSEVELLQDDEILRTVVQNAALMSEGRSWFWNLVGDNDEKRLARAVRRIGTRLRVEAVHKTALINVSYESSDAEQGASVLRCLANAYLERHHRVHRSAGQFDFFNQQVVLARGNLEGTELQLLEFTRDQGVVSAAQERDIALQKLSEADSDDRQTRVAMAEDSQRILALQSKLGSLPERTMTQIRSSDNPQLLEKMKARLLDLELKRTELLTQYEPTYRTVQEVEQEIAQTKAAIAAQDQTPIRDQTSDLEPNHEWAKSELVKAQVELSALRAHAAAAAPWLVHYRDLAHQLGDRAIEQERVVADFKAAEDKYLLYLNKREEARIGDALDQDGILNVTIAEQPTVPALPKLSLASFGLIGLALAGTLSLALAFAMDYLNPAFRTPDEIVGYLGVPVLASLPCKNLVDAEIFAKGQP